MRVGPAAARLGLFVISAVFFLPVSVCVCARAERGVEPASERLLVGCAVDLWS
jgi:hypothetical protein